MAIKDKFELTGVLSEDCTSIKLDFPKIMPRLLRKIVGKRLLVKFEILRKKRSDAQNRYLHGVICVKVMYWHKHTQGEEITMDECKAYIYSKVLGYQMKFKEVLGEEVIVMEGKRMSKMNTVEFNDAKEKIQVYFGPLGCPIPDPREENFITNYID